MGRDAVANQFQLTIGLPVSALAGWATLWIEGLQLWQRVMEAQIDLLNHQAEFMRTHNYIARGADWMDHYGRRSRDVNVERV